MSDVLMDWLKQVVEQQDLNGFQSVDPIILQSLIQYLTNIIPTQVFTSPPQEEVVQLQQLCEILKQRFFDEGKIPFTMRRICELIYKPLFYYQPNELNKFNHAMEKCVNVETEYDFSVGKTMKALLLGTRDNNSVKSNDVTEDVSMSKIPFLPSNNDDDELKIRKEYNEFLREIDSVMSINYEYDDEEDEEEDEDYIVTPQEQDEDDEEEEEPEEDDEEEE